MAQTPNRCESIAEQVKRDHAALMDCCCKPSYEQIETQNAALLAAIENIQLEARSRVPSIAVIAKLAMDAISITKGK